VDDVLCTLDSLANQAHPEGGWGYAPGQGAHLEPTCLALLALALEPDRYAAVSAAGRRFLERCAQPDGSYQRAGGREEAVWPTALVLFVQTALDCPADEVQKTAGRLLALRGRPPQNADAGELHDIDVQLIGWPWAEGNFSWAEPTAWACLALRHAGLGGHERVQEGLRLLLDRASDTGGINYGNRRILGRTTEPIPGPTALMLLALQGREDHPRVAAAIAYLLQQAAAGDDLEHLGWAKLALDLYRDRPEVAAFLPALDDHIREAQHRRAEES
jgi:hypothetical protein